jgi:hypothetical protein
MNEADAKRLAKIRALFTIGVPNLEGVRENVRFLLRLLDEATAWQPIETAPRDGETNIELFTTSHGIVQAWYSPGRWFDFYEGREYDGAVWVCADDAFQIEVEELPNNKFHDGAATHWRPLPPPPEDKG